MTGTNKEPNRKQIAPWRIKTVIGGTAFICVLSTLVASYTAVRSIVAVGHPDDKDIPLLCISALWLGAGLLIVSFLAWTWRYRLLALKVTWCLSLLSSLCLVVMTVTGHWWDQLWLGLSAFVMGVASVLIFITWRLPSLSESMEEANQDCMTVQDAAPQPHLTHAEAVLASESLAIQQEYERVQPLIKMRKRLLMSVTIVTALLAGGITVLVFSEAAILAALLGAGLGQAGARISLLVLDQQRALPKTLRELEARRGQLAQRTTSRTTA